MSLELIKAGLAWHYKRYSSDPVLAKAEEQARRQKLGLWSMPNPIPPWEYRRWHRRHDVGILKDIVAAKIDVVATS